jgi:hypothetical protein
MGPNQRSWHKADDRLGDQLVQIRAGKLVLAVPGTKRFACSSAASALKGQERRDQMQLCLLQARLDCLKQAIAQKIVGPQRTEFMSTCAQ